MTTKLAPNEYLIGNQPDPNDRRLIRVEDWGTQRILALRRGDEEYAHTNAAGVTDLISGHDLLLERIDCGLGDDCWCALGIREDLGIR